MCILQLEILGLCFYFEIKLNYQMRKQVNVQVEQTKILNLDRMRSDLKKELLVSLQKPNQSAALTQYQNINKKAREQLIYIQARKKITPTLKSAQSQKFFKNNIPVISKLNQPLRMMSKNYSEKYFKKRSDIDISPSQIQEKLIQNCNFCQQDEVDNNQAGMQHTNYKQLLRKNDYRKLHDKLDTIETKIAVMKRNLKIKKQEQLNMMNPNSKNKISQDEKKQNTRLQELVTQMPEHEQLKVFDSNPYSPRHNIYYVSELVRAYQDERSLAREHLVTSLNILKVLQNTKMPTDNQIFKLQLARKKGYQNRKTLIFDLDETLIHCNQSIKIPYDVKLPIKFPTGEIIEAGINIRPYARQILKNLSNYFEIIIFTASHSCYANVVLDYLDSNKQWVHHRLFRQHCYFSSQGMYIKDLRIIDREMRNMILVDNAAYSYVYQLQNGVPIFPYYHGQIDFELKMLEQYLMKLVFSQDVRQINSKTFRLNQYTNYLNRPEKLVEELYLNK